MSWTLQREHLAPLSSGASLLSGGGGGSTRITELAASTVPWPVPVHSVAEVDPATPCVAVGVGGSTMVFRERLAGADLFVDAIAAVDRYTGSPARAVCLTEIGGMNALTALPLAASMALIDADLMGRALPGIDQFTLLVDDLPGLVIAVPTGPRGAMLIADARPADIEHVLRAAFETAGGWAGIVIGGFHVGDLAAHAVLGSLTRALRLGRGWGEGHVPLSERIAATSARSLGVGQVAAIELDPADVRVRVIDIAAKNGTLLRLIARSEILACMVDGRVRARSPEIIDVVDPQSGTVHQVQDITLGRHLAVLSFDAPHWWHQRPPRLARVLPSHYGLEGLDQVDP